MHEEHERASMEHHRRGVRVNNMSFDERTVIARSILRVLPPGKFYNRDETNNCPICKEEFKKGELIQPFALCAHQFHSWLLGGKTTCPICRQDLSTIV
ncbi:hypothetical protein TSUD_112190 [Trifolium subterraneum]|uniref:RING-type domain-containing protein n=1 Tax=Trifolium subterraneum TaxID=3900 RepID=A0A2Z6PJF3_TRISU|nr:hypothetical protein TSUD_112190 [Trifolium subterraneum]